MPKNLQNSGKKAPAPAQPSDDPRLPALRTLINRNLVPTFPDIFKHIPASILARYMKMNYDRMVMLKEEPKKITVEEIDRLSELIGVEMRKVWKMVEASGR